MAISEKRARSLMEVYYEDIYKFCCVRCREPQAAFDITQETFTVFYRNRKKLDDTHLRAYLYKTANNLICAYLRSLSIEQNFVSIDDCELVEQESDCFDKISEEDFERLLTGTQKKILAMLNDSEREVFIKLYMEKKSVRLVAEETGLSENNIYVKSHRIKKKVKKGISSGELLTLVLIFKFFIKSL